MHCGLCLPTCPTYDATHMEKNSPRGRIALMRAIADDKIVATEAFADEMYFCLGCLACMTACPAVCSRSSLRSGARRCVTVLSVAPGCTSRDCVCGCLAALVTRQRQLCEPFNGDLIESIAGDRVYCCTVSPPQVSRVWYVCVPVAAQSCTPHEICPPSCACSHCCATVFALWCDCVRNSIQMLTVARTRCVHC